MHTESKPYVQSGWDTVKSDGDLGCRRRQRSTGAAAPDEARLSSGLQLVRMHSPRRTNCSYCAHGPTESPKADVRGKGGDKRMQQTTESR